jgi:4-hydroxysphinganine ceramide fatty acyl 2-hydroxylase
MHNMATTHPKLLLWFASKNPFFVFLKLLPIIYILIVPFKDIIAFKWSFAIHFFIGLLVWSIFEYVVHRWIYHIQFKNKKIKWFLEAFHLYHHQYLDKHHVLNAGFLIIYPLFASFWIIYFLATQNVIATSFFCFGVIAYYFFYEIVHYFIHYKKYQNGYLQFIQKYHLYHHYKKSNKNFGNTSTLWDVVLGTYDKQYKVFDVSATDDKHFITNKIEKD